MTYDHAAERRKRNRAHFIDSAYQDANGVWRWKSNDRVPFDDMLEDNDIDADLRKKCEEARDEETSAFLAEYRVAQANRPADQIAEERMEARTALGDGVQVVNILTGEKFTT